MESNRKRTQTDALSTRPSRAADHASENAVLLRLARAQTGSRGQLLQEVADAALLLCNAGSSGISLVEETGLHSQFRWLAVAGLCVGLEGKATAWRECPCGLTLESGEPQLFVQPQEHFPSLRFPGVEITEGLVVPIPTGSGFAGAIWVMSHTPTRRFDLEDVRLLSNLAVSAGAALTIVDARDIGAENDRRHGEFVAMLGHELRNPMAPIDSAIGAAKRLCADNEKAVEVLTIAQRQMRHLRTLIDDLLDAARLKHGKLAIKHSDTSLNEIAFDAVTAVKHHIESRRHSLKLTGLEVPVPVRADHVRLSQVLGNLLSNAAKYTPVGGTIELAVKIPSDLEKSGGDVVVIEIVDNGIGIDSSLQPHVFELFAQSARGSARAEGGLGIGLAVAKRMVELHDGTISIHSEGANRGTVVTLRLPILRSQAERLAAKDSAESLGLGPVRLLLVDDNPDALQSLGILLELDGHQITTCDNGHDAVRLVNETHPEVAIIDIGMPEMDGFEVARVIRADERLDNVMLIALTGYAAEPDKSRALAAGFDCHLTKPLSLEKLQSILANRAGEKLGGIV
ncbi:hybrid sensor histidine kinase/response regulator [Paraburkholderia sp. CI3]|uniref:hybrid sensor histidine kinase/response regulator n=1 Tax=Paraburkholderia sp. CI3 TaxID=2991060 RepID=UPI003D1B9F8A